ncbi:MAG: ribonuclease HII [Clostridia bacterium]|nr:ribonuclease HII [Clostridia bacterium]
MARRNEEERLFELTKIERTYWEKGILPAGMDEVGRGPLAGPVVTACVILPPEPLIKYINDSKKVSQGRREKLYPEIKAAAIACATGWKGPGEIDELNILNATRRAFEGAFGAMERKPSVVLMDAMTGVDMDAEQHSFIHGDALSYLIAAASIIAKVERDRYMLEMDAVYPEYGFARNKGYGTAEHIAALKKYGPCPIHRRSFIKNFIGE